MAKAKKSVVKKSAVTPAKKTEVALIDLPPEEVRAMARPREGFEAHGETLFGLYEKYIDELRIKSLDTEQAREHMRRFAALAPDEAAAKKHLEMVQDTRVMHSTSAWGAMLEIYAKAQAAARTNREIAAAISGFVAFMKHGPRKAKAGKKGGDGEGR